MQEVEAGGTVATVEQERKPNYHRGKLIAYRVGGHGFAVLLMGGTAIAIFFPGATVLLLNDVEPVGVIILSSLNMLAKFNLGYYGLMFPVIETFSKWAADEDEEALTSRDIVTKGAFFVVSGPLVIVFSLGALYSIEEFQKQVANQTANTATQLPELFFQVANATQIPAVKGILVGATGGFNLIANIWVLLFPAVILGGYKTEYEQLLFDEKMTSEEKERAIRKYQIGMWAGTSFFLSVGTVGNVVYLPFTALMYKYFWDVPLPGGYVMGAEMFCNMMLLAFLCLLPLGKDLTEGLIDIKRGEFEWPSKPQVGINIVKGGTALGVVGAGALYSVFNAKAAGLDLFLQTASGVLGSLLELGMMYKLLGVVEHGIKYLIYCGHIPEKKAVKTKDIEKADGQLQASVSLEESSSIEQDFERSKRPITPPPDGDKGKVSWGKWFGSFFKCCCDGSRGKHPMRHATSSDALMLAGQLTQGVTLK